MRIGIVCPYDMGRPGGVQSQVRGLANALASAGQHVRIIAPGRAEHGIGVSVGGSVRVPANRSKAPIALSPRVVERVREASRTVDLLHVHEPLMPLVSLAALRSGPPVVATFHAAPSMIGRGIYRLLGSSVARVLGKQVNVVTAVSRTAADVLPASLPVTIVPNAIDVDAFGASVDKTPTRVAFIGRDEPRKGLDVLVAAWPVVLAAVPSAELVVMGADRGLPDIRWVNHVSDSDKASILGSSGVYVAPSIGGESFGVVLVEGMAAGAALVSSDLKAYRDVAGDAAVYFETGNARALAQALIDLLGDDERRDALADVGRVRATEFDWSVVAARYESIYEHALS